MTDLSKLSIPDLLQHAGLTELQPEAMDAFDELARRLEAQRGVQEGWKPVPVEPITEQWGGFARAFMHWLDLSPGPKTPRSLLIHLGHCGIQPPQWLMDEGEMQNLDHSMSKGTCCVIIYKAMLAEAPLPPSEVSERDKELLELCEGIIAHGFGRDFIRVAAALKRRIEGEGN